MEKRSWRNDIQKMRFMLSLNLYEKRNISLQEAADMNNVNETMFIQMMDEFNDGIIFG